MKNKPSPVSIGYANVFPDKEISRDWLLAWSEIQIFYGDVQKKESETEFLKRMQSIFDLKQKP